MGAGTEVEMHRSQMRCGYLLTLAVCSLAAKSGCIRGNCQDGLGTFLWSDGQKYEGEFKGGHGNGKGALTTPDGRKHNGQFADGVLVSRAVKTGCTGNCED